METLYEKSSLILNPGVYDTGKVYCTKPFDGSGDLTFTRNSNATRVNADGLVEKVRANYAAYSEAFDNAAWTKNAGATITANTTANPLGGELTADTLNIAPNLYCSIYLYTGLSSGNYTNSLYVKAGTLNYFWILIDGSSGKYVFFNLSNGTVHSQSSGMVGRITSLSNGWYRCSITNESLSGNQYHQFGFSDNTGFQPTVSGTGYIYGAMAELSDFGPTDYISTTSAAVSVGPTANVPRLNYSNGCPSLLLEPQRTNLMPFSEQYNDASWTKLNATVTANATVSPDGYSNADQLTDDSTNGTHLAYKILASRSTGTAWSVFMKKGTLDYGFIGNVQSGTAFTTAVIDLTNGTVKELQNGSGNTGSVTVQDYGSGWYRVIMQSSANGGGTSIGTSDGSALSGATKDAIYSGTGKHIYVWGAQLEDATYATSYIPSLGASVTRLADEAYKTGISSLIGQTEGTFFVDLNRSFVTGNYDRYAVLDDAYASIYQTGVFVLPEPSVTGRVYIVLRNNGADILSYPLNNTTDQRLKIAVAYKSGDIAIYVNGVQKATSTTPYTFAHTLQQVKHAGNSEAVNQTLVFKTRLTNAQLAELTTL